MYLVYCREVVLNSLYLPDFILHVNLNIFMSFDVIYIITR